MSDNDAVKDAEAVDPANNLEQNRDGSPIGMNDQASEKFSQYSPVKITDVEVDSNGNNRERPRVNSNNDKALIELV